MRERSLNTVQFVISKIHINISYRDILKLFMRERNHTSTQGVVSTKVVLKINILMMFMRERSLANHKCSIFYLSCSSNLKQLFNAVYERTKPPLKNKSNMFMRLQMKSNGFKPRI